MVGNSRNRLNVYRVENSRIGLSAGYILEVIGRKTEKNRAGISESR